MSLSKLTILPTIKVDRVSLRWLTELDIDDLYKIFSDPVVMRYWSSAPLVEKNAVKQLLDSIHHSFTQQSFFQWGITLHSDNHIIGTCTLGRIDFNNRHAEIGYILGRNYWGQGYIQEALRALINFAFDELNFHRLEADVDPRNVASVRTLEKLGFQKEGYLRERWHVNGEIQDALFYGLLRREWLPSVATTSKNSNNAL